MAKVLTGIVTSDVRDKTITVTITSRETHPVYGKQYTVRRKYQAHDPKNEAHVGDKVQISEIRPVSKTKTFQLASIEARAKGSVELKDEPELVEKKATPKKVEKTEGEEAAK
ncbi:30S ribosomal protein S17 [Candidatus Saccharibacteria bacterium]|nr:30S ribosomal protein S17 [Candidatus Saccharibacteria bacterium]